MTASVMASNHMKVRHEYISFDVEPFIFCILVAKFDAKKET